LFEPTSVVEIRLIETWQERGKQQSRVVERLWLPPEAIQAALPNLRERNREGANIFFGVNPRLDRRGTKESVAKCRSLWCDWDGIDVNEALRRCKSNHLPDPSILVSSGHGAHGYWLLTDPVDVSNPKDRELFQTRLRWLCRSLGADATSDVTRLLRLPGEGLLNVKNLRNGIRPVPCEIIRADYKTRFALKICEHWGLDRIAATEAPPVTLRPMRRASRIRGLMRLLKKDTDDRSRRDFFVVVTLLRIGCTEDEIFTLVRDQSKFAGNEPYLRRTIHNARGFVASNRV
jgi:hypothetical protein